MDLSLLSNKFAYIKEHKESDEKANHTHLCSKHSPDESLTDTKTFVSIVQDSAENSSNQQHSKSHDIRKMENKIIPTDAIEDVPLSNSLKKSEKENEVTGLVDEKLNQDDSNISIADMATKISSKQPNNDETIYKETKLYTESLIDHKTTINSPITSINQPSSPKHYKRQKHAGKCGNLNTVPELSSGSGFKKPDSLFYKENVAIKPNNLLTRSEDAKRINRQGISEYEIKKLCASNSTRKRIEFFEGLSLKSSRPENDLREKIGKRIVQALNASKQNVSMRRDSGIGSSHDRGFDSDSTGTGSLPYKNPESLGAFIQRHNNWRSKPHNVPQARKNCKKLAIRQDVPEKCHTRKLQNQQMPFNVCYFHYLCTRSSVKLKKQTYMVNLSKLLKILYSDISQNEGATSK
ncbi:hypothetical protein ENBRE01_1605 [Enteropsectra breve]|nr:hypothetical protein ENBRE01_1605 [Enteropsectra breve]